MSQSQLQNLLAQKKYRQAIEEIKKLQRSQPDLVITPTEAEVWTMRGQQELEGQEFKAAENSFRQALKLGLVSYYGLAKALLAQNRLDVALDLVGKAFEAQTLAKEEGICYLKLLLLKGNVTAVETLMQKQSKRFSAPQLHWARGVLALKAGDPDAAMLSFGKLKKAPLTPGDSTDAWMAYCHQQAGKWDLASGKLGLGARLDSSRFTPIFGRPKAMAHPAIEKLVLFQQINTGDTNRLSIAANRSSQELLTALSALQLMAEGNIHDAGHAILKLKPATPQLKPLMALKSKILTLAGQQAQTQGMTSCAVELWEPLLQEKTLDGQFMVNLLEVLTLEEEAQDCQRLVTRLIKWIEAEAKRDPSQWPEAYLKRTLADAHCRLADAWLSCDRVNAAFGAIQQAERLCPTSPEVIGRRGLIVYDGGDHAGGLALLTQAIEQGCRSDDVYERLQDGLRAAGRKDEVLALRKRYGQTFGDLHVEEEIEIEPWIEALATENAELFGGMLPSEPAPDPALRACQLFNNAAHGRLTTTGKTSIHQDQAIQAWDQALVKLSPIDRAKMLQAIVLCIVILSKRDKGIAALATRYQNELFKLVPTVPEAQVLHLVASAVKEGNPQKLQVYLKPYLDAQPQPGNALAVLQLQVRWFGQTANLRSFIDQALKREPQNPMLLLANATSFGVDSQPYRTLHQQGFELARQLQDAQALQAFRVEEHYVKDQRTLGMMSSFMDRDEEDFDGEAMFEEMVRRVLGDKVPRQQLEMLMPLLKLKFLQDTMGMDSRLDLGDLESLFGGAGPRKRKQRFMDL